MIFGVSHFPTSYVCKWKSSFFASMLNNLEMFISIPLDVSDYIWVCTFIRYFRAFGKSWLGGGRKGLVLVVNENGE